MGYIQEKGLQGNYPS